MRIAVVGAGAMGTMTGALLEEAGEEVVLCSRNREHVATIKEEGLVLGEIAGERTVSIEATDNIKDIGVADLIIVFVKSYDTETIASAARDIAAENTIVLTLQNGLGNVEILERAFGKGRVLAGTSDAAATVVEPGRVRHTANGNIYIGEVEGKISPRVEKIVNLFKKAGFSAHATDNAVGSIWTKLLLNVAINPLGTILRSKCGKLIDNEPTKRVMRAAVEEGLGIVRAKEISLLYPDMVQAAYDLAEKNAESFNSMAQDFFKGKKTEIDSMNGAIVRPGEEVGVPTPVNRVLTDLVKAMEHGVEEPTRHSSARRRLTAATS